MLTKIKITNLATIQALALNLTTGLTVITGDTGAGKSIIIDAILFALGLKSGAHLIARQNQQLTVTLSFRLADNDILQLIPALQHGSKSEQHLTRSITPQGKTTTLLNNQSLSLVKLRYLASILVNVHSQHSQQSLLQEDKQRELIDSFAGNQDLCGKIKAISEEYVLLDKNIGAQQTILLQHLAQTELLQEQLDELQGAKIHDMEWQKLTEEQQQLSHAEHISQQLQQTLNNLQYAETYNIRSALYKTLKMLQALVSLSPVIGEWAESLNNIALQLDDVTDNIHHYLAKLENHHDKLSLLNQRMTVLHDLARKYQVSPELLPNLMTNIATKLTKLHSTSQDLAQLQLKQQNLIANYVVLATQLSQQRHAAAAKLSQAITAIIKTLNLPDAMCQIKVISNDNNNTPMCNGFDKIAFLIKTNIGSEFYPLAKIISGGELSRLSLAVHLVATAQTTIPTIIFDEVDVGIGGGTAALVGKLLRELGAKQQVLCITHLPQVAVYGQQQLHVTKTTQNNTTTTTVEELTAQERITEIARMLGGVNITATTIQHAKEMLIEAKYNIDY
jgi:DNA repair protein RecN (Recombination protein N)